MGRSSNKAIFRCGVNFIVRRKSIWNKRRHWMFCFTIFFFRHRCWSMAVSLIQHKVEVKKIKIWQKLERANRDQAILFGMEIFFFFILMSLISVAGKWDWIYLLLRLAAPVYPNFCFLLYLTHCPYLRLCSDKFVWIYGWVQSP